MRSKANFKSHPLHPLLVAFPIAFYTGTFLLDVLAFFYRASFTQIGLEINANVLHIGALAFALLAALPGIVDYVKVVPPNSSAKKRAANHALLNSVCFILFLIAFIIKITGKNMSIGIPLILETVGMAALVAAGWMGGTLVYRNQIGVDIRYAYAGKWKEAVITTAEKKVAVANNDELKAGQMKLLHINGERIVIAKMDDGFAAFSDHCTHKGGSLAAGALICNTVQCPWHGSQFHVKTGEVKAGPANAAIVTYAISEENGKVYIILP
jgi:nitrite reductase/ring-hydroxylating ferredoxin subunit/uncharacterized membrane protein